MFLNLYMQSLAAFVNVQSFVDTRCTEPDHGQPLMVFHSLIFVA